MNDPRGMAHPGHFLTRCTTDKLTRYLDMAEDQGVFVVTAEFVGGRDWIIVTRPGPILGPAASRAFSTTQE